MTANLFPDNQNCITLFIPGIPQPKQSVRSRVIPTANGKHIAIHYQTKEVKETERNIRAIVISQLPSNFVLFSKGLIISQLHYSFPPLKSFNAKIQSRINSGEQIPKTTKPDLTDNLNKGLFDALQGLIYLNDSQICELNNCKKFYSNKPGILLTIQESEY